jgi:hypothetical protein
MVVMDKVIVIPKIIKNTQLAKNNMRKPITKDINSG